MNIFVFSGGGAYALPEIGIAKYLKKEKIYNPEEDVVIGTSFGAITAGILVYNFDDEDIVQMMNDFENKLHNLFTIGSAFFAGLRFIYSWGVANLLAILGPYFGGPHAFPDNLYTVATSYTHMKPHIWGAHSKISSLEAIASSASVPFAFIPVSIHDELYVDGGLFENVPLSAVKIINLEHENTNIYVIGNFKGYNGFYIRPTNLFSYLEGYVNGAIYNFNKYNTQDIPSSYYEIPFKPNAKYVFDFSNWKRDIQEGYIDAMNFFAHKKEAEK